MKLEDRVAALTLEDKVRLLTGADGWSMVALPQIGLRRLVMSDGPVGVRGERWDETDTSTNLPSPTAIAASWDERLVHRLGRLLAFEARRKNVDVLLAPTVNLHRSPLGGRHFECYSEDPLLTARIGTAYVRGLQSGGVGACVKHFVANDSETERLTYDARIDERALRELYLAPFEAIVRDGEAWSVMAAYNAVNGHTMTESAMLEEILKQDWGFDGVVVSDWSAARSTEGTANAGLDLAMPGPDGPWGDALLEAVRNGRVPEWRIDEKVRRLLRLASRVGALDGHDGIEPPELAPEDVTATVRGAAAAGFVLARNHESLLPLDAEELRTVALLGPGADAARTQGGGSATVFPPYTVSPLEGLRSALGDRARVTHAVGAEASSMLPPISGDVTVRFLDAEGRVVAEQSKQTTRFLWLGSFGDDVPSDRVAAVEATVVLRPEHTGDHLLEICGVGSFTVEVAGRTVLDRTLRPDDESEPFLAIVKPPRTSTPVRLEAGSRVELRVRSTVSGPFAAFAVGHREPGRTEDEELEHAVALAAAADVAVVVVGTSAEIESEGFDRESLALPGRQNELVDRVLEVNPRTVVVVNAGAPVELPWADRAPAVLLSWFPGQEFGNALADVLLGHTEPGGRLPTSWPVVAEDCPVLSTRPRSGVLAYDESIHLGYRGWARTGRTPRYPFGHGLGYTTWEYGEARAEVGQENCVVRIPVTNTGRRRGKTVAQVYASRTDSAIDRPRTWLVGFTVVEADPGETVAAEIGLSSRAFAHWDVTARSWQLEPGEFALAIGASSSDIRAITTVVVDSGQP